MYQHRQLTEKRITGFIDRLWTDVYEEKQPLSAKVAVSETPITYKEAMKLKYRPIKTGDLWGKAWTTGWFKFSGKIPAEWAGAEVMYLIDTGSEACVFDKQGVPNQGLTNISGGNWFTRKALYPAFKRAKGGEALSLEVEAVGNYLFGVDVFERKYSYEPRLKDAFIVKFRRDIWEFWHEIKQLWDLYLALPENSPRKAKILRGLDDAANEYQVARKSREGAEAGRKALKPLLKMRANASSSTVSAIGHSHIDTAWLWPLRETRRKVARTFSTVIKLMEEYPDYKFGASQPQLYQFCKEDHPKLYQKIKKAVKEGRWEPQGGMWVEADCNLSSGESLVRQIIHGKKFFMDEFGWDVKNLWLPDVFGYSFALPQILTKTGIEYFITQKISWSQFNKFPHMTFNWEGLDGTRIFTHFLPTNDYNGTYLSGELAKGEENFKEIDRAGRWLYLFGLGDGGGGPSRHHMEFAKHVKNLEGCPKTVQEFASDFLPKAKKDIVDIPVWKGELYLEFHRGTYTTQARNKRANRKSEFLLRELEWIRSFDMKTFPAPDVDRLWKVILLNQFHDIIPGSSITWVYEDSLKQYAALEAEAEKLTVEGAKALAKSVNMEGEGTPVLVTNSLSWDRTEVFSVPAGSGAKRPVMTDENGRHIPSQPVKSENGDELLCLGDIPSMGYRVFYVNEGESGRETGPVAEKELLENEFLRVKFDKDGRITSIYDKENGRETVKAGQPANVFTLHDETGNDAWDFFIWTEEMKPFSPKMVKCEISEKGPVRAAIRQEWKISETSKLVQEIRLVKGGRKLEFFTKVDWNEDEKMLRVNFPVEIHSAKASFETQFGFVERATHRNTSWDMAKHEVCMHKFADISEEGYGVALLNDCKYGVRVFDSAINMALLRSPKYPDVSADIASHTFTYSIYPHKGGLKEGAVTRAGYEQNVPLRALVCSSHKGNLPGAHSDITVDNENLVIDTVKKAEDSNALVVRLYESNGARGKAFLKVNRGIKKAAVTDMLERETGSLKLENGTVELEFRPFEIITLKFE